MKSIVFAILVAFGTPYVYANTEAKETRQVCVDVKKDGKTVTDPKTGKAKQTCRTVKVHKKLDDATKVPAK